MEDYYTILEINKSATPAEIKKAYYKCSAKYHPDKTGGNIELTEKFKNCNEAYEILSDPEKRSLYDKYGKEGLNGGNSGFNPFEGFGGFTQRKSKTEDIHIQLNVKLEDLYYGKNINHKYNRNICCKKCNGKGTCKDINSTCPDCGGKKQKLNVVRQGNTVYQSFGPCQKCNATGVLIKEEDKCKTCHGNQVITEEKIINIEIEKGLSWGDKVVYSGFANEQPGILTGDVIIILTQHEKSIYERQDDDLILKLNINLLQSLNGKEIKFTHLNNKEVIISDKISPGDIRVLKKYGMPIRNTQEYGNLYIIFNVVYDINDAQINKIINILNPDLTEKLKGLSLEKVTTLPKPKKNQQNQQHQYTQQNQQCTQQ